MLSEYLHANPNILKMGQLATRFTFAALLLSNLSACAASRSEKSNPQVKLEDLAADLCAYKSRAQVITTGYPVSLGSSTHWTIGYSYNLESGGFSPGFTSVTETAYQLRGEPTAHSPAITMMESKTSMLRTFGVPLANSGTIYTTRIEATGSVSQIKNPEGVESCILRVDSAKILQENP